MNPAASDVDFHGAGRWAVILGGSSGFGLAAARRLGRAGLHLCIGHKDSTARCEAEVHPEFDRIRALGVELVSYNGNLGEEDARGELLERLGEHAPRGSVHVFLHSIAAGSCKLAVEDLGTTAAQRDAAIREVASGLAAAGHDVSPALLRQAINTAFHDKGRDALFALADTAIPYQDDLLSEADLAQTILMMGYDYLLWGRELLQRGFLAPGARLVALTSEGNARAFRGYAAIAAAKAALEALCRALALEMAPYGVRSFLVQAGVTDTPAGNAIPNFDLMKAVARLRNPFGRLTTPDDVANAIFALSLPLCDWVNGAVIRVDGGESVVDSR